MLRLATIITIVAAVASARPITNAIGEHRVPAAVMSVDYFSDFHP